MATTKNILSSTQAMQNCLKANNTEWYDKHMERVVNTLLESLPHGSGIDCDWSFDITNKAIYCYNSYHVMNDNGCYNGYIDFAVIIKTTYRTIDGQLSFRISGRFGKDQDLKDNLYEKIDFAIEKL